MANVWRNPAIFNEQKRPKSASTVYFHTDSPIGTQWSDIGKTNKTSILRGISRCRSAIETPCSTSWVSAEEKLCKIREDYRFSNGDDKIQKHCDSSHSFLTGSRYTSSYWLDLNSKQEGIFTSKADLHNTFQLPKQKIQRKRLKSAPPRINNEMADKGSNTDFTFLSISNWHGATWQHSLPEMYRPLEERYDSYASIPVRTKHRETFYPNPSVTRRDKT